PAGIVIASAVALAVLAGTGLGIFFMLRAGAGNEVDAATVKVWDEYESMLDENSANAPQVTVDRSALAKSQEDLKKEQEQVTALEAVLAKTAGSKARRSRSGKSTSKQDVKADQMAAVLKAHKEYVEKLQELFTALDGANLLDPNVVANINKIIADLGKLGDKVKTLAKDFLKDNDKVASVRFDPSFLDFSSEAAADLQKNVTDAKSSGQQPPTTTPTTSTSSVVGTYSGNGGTLTLNADGTCVASRPEVTVSGTYVVSGNTITFTSSDGVTDTGTIESDGSIILQGARLTKQ
ncbi:MAG: lipocalin family protein, partial [Deltaproteobacteria bacterium]|nr:lipocalin family protein [Deltaproteobacteria bacterium]